MLAILTIGLKTMSDSGPWDDYAAPTALPPTATPPDTKPWEDYGGSSSMPTQPPQSVMGAVGAALQAQPGMMADAMTNPVTQAHALPVLAGAAGSVLGPGGATAGNVGGNLLSDAALASYGRSDQIPSVAGQVSQGVLAGASDVIPAIIKVPDSLKSAGINPTTLDHMAPGGQPPGDWALAVEKQLKNNGVLANTANETWKLMNAEKDKVGAAIGDIMNKIGQASPEALQVDAQTALAPLSNEAKQLGGSIFSAGKTAATPYEEANNALMQQAQSQGGKLNLDNIQTALDQAGKLMNGGQKAVEEFGPVYGKLANVRDNIVQGIADQSGNPDLATDLLKNNADYSTYMRLLPTIEKSGYREAVKAGVSAFQKHGGPLVTKVAATMGAYDELKKAISKVTGE